MTRGGTAGVVTVWPAPPGERLSRDFAVSAGGRVVPVLVTRVAPRDPELRWKAMDDKADSAKYFEEASFASFDMTGAVRVEVECPHAVTQARILPSCLGILPRLDGTRLIFDLARPGQIVVEVNGDWVHSLQLFANPAEANRPSPQDPDVVWFGPGVHDITHLEVGSGKTVYVAGGAVVRGVIGPEEPYKISSYSGLRTYSPTIHLNGAGIRLRGRGIIDGSASTTHARNLILATGSDIDIEGVILRDSSTWNIPIRGCDRVCVRNVKILGYRANSDGVDICSSRDVVVEDCFLRTLDDLIVVKTDKGLGPARRIAARRCVLWNEVAHSLSIGAELREDVDDVLFEDCDVIHDKGREWTMRVFHCDSARVSNVRFQDIRIEESPALISLWINVEQWTRDDERGHISGVRFRDISARTDTPRVEILGFDDDHIVEDVTFENVTVNGKPLPPEAVTRNEFTRGLRLG